MFIPNEAHYREIIRPEHWDKFVARLPKIEAPFSVGDQSGSEMTAHFVALQLMDEYPDDYLKDEED